MYETEPGYVEVTYEHNRTYPSLIESRASLIEKCGKGTEVCFPGPREVREMTLGNIWMLFQGQSVVTV
jgi:hypothetical protein